MFLIAIEKGEAFSVGIDDLLQFLDDRAAGGERELARYGGVGIGEAVGDVSAMTPNQALAFAERIRTAQRLDLKQIVAA